MWYVIVPESAAKAAFERNDFASCVLPAHFADPNVNISRQMEEMGSLGRCSGGDMNPLGEFDLLECCLGRAERVLPYVHSRNSRPFVHKHPGVGIDMVSS